MFGAAERRPARLACDLPGDLHRLLRRGRRRDHRRGALPPEPDQVRERDRVPRLPGRRERPERGQGGRERAAQRRLRRPRLAGARRRPAQGPVRPRLHRHQRRQRRPAVRARPPVLGRRFPLPVHRVRPAARRGRRLRSGTRRRRAGWVPPIGKTARCSWDPTDPDSWQVNREQTSTQAFYFANVFHDHLAGPTIGFTDDTDGFGGDGTGEQGDFVERQRQRRRRHRRRRRPGRRPHQQRQHVDAARRPEPADAELPVRVRPGPTSSTSATSTATTTRRPSGTSTRTGSATGWSSTTTARARSRPRTPARWARRGATGTRSTSCTATGSRSTTSDKPGEVDIGVYSDAVFTSTRFSPADCPPNAITKFCPGGISTGIGGFTFGDFGKVFAGARGPLRRRDLAADALGPAHPAAAGDRQRAGRVRPLRGAGHRGHAALAARALLPRRAQRDPRRRPGRHRRRPAGPDLARVRRPRDGLLRQRRRLQRRHPDRGLQRAARSRRADGRGSAARSPAPTPGCRSRGSRSASAGTRPTRRFPDTLSDTTDADGHYSFQAPAGRYGELVFKGAAGFDQISVEGINLERRRERGPRREHAPRLGGVEGRGDDRRAATTPAARSAAASRR